MYNLRQPDKDWPESEDSLHKVVAKLLGTVLSPEVVWTSVEQKNVSGNDWRAKKRGAALKAKGVKSGWPDIQIFWQDCGVAKGLFIELKKKGEYAKSHQKAIHTALKSALFYTAVCKSWDEVYAALVYSGVPRRSVMFSQRS